VHLSLFLAGLPHELLLLFFAHGFLQVGVGGTDSLAIYQFCKQIAMAEAGAWHLLRCCMATWDTKCDSSCSDVRDTAPATGVPGLRMVFLGKPYNIGSGKQMSIQDLLTVAISQARVAI